MNRIMSWLFLAALTATGCTGDGKKDTSATPPPPNEIFDKTDMPEDSKGKETAK